ncbi:MAG TPA: sigma 54-interacting transcriptional regulator [Labilithrix sp.]|nr:sigma 54-interacting transcriptional regulator [Labilithrix sp.]
MTKIGRDDETSVLWACIRDLASLSATPSRWVGRTPREAVEGLLEVLVGALRLDLAYARIDDLVFEAACSGGPSGRPLTSDVVRQIGRALAPSLGSAETASFRSPIDGKLLSVAVLPLSPGSGVVAVGSKRIDFPSALESLVLASAIDQGAIWLTLARSQHRVSAAEDRLTLEREDAGLRKEVDTPRVSGGIVGQSQALHDILAEVELVAPTEASVLILGESGTGKEIIATAIHACSRRASGPLIKVNCSAIPREVFESEFFGHVRGAFSGAVRDRPGRFLLADKGTIFLDEVGDLPLELQPKLLRVLQEGQFESVGDDNTRFVDVRMIAATNRDLAEEVLAGRFREDLYYRLCVFPIRLPALRDRKDDIVPLAEHFIRGAAREAGVRAPELGPDEVAALQSYDWPGNVRELQNVIERAVILRRGDVLDVERVLRSREEQRQTSAVVPASTRAGSDNAPRVVVSDKEWRRRERENLIAALAQTEGRIYGIRGAAALLGVKPSTLQSRLRSLGIRTRDPSSGPR